MKQQLAVIPELGDTGRHVEIVQQKLKDAHGYAGLVDGDFGPKTRSAIIQFQSSNGLSISGKLDAAALELLGLELETGIGTDSYSNIVDIVDRSRISRVVWANRGRAAYGYYHGMALMFARLYTRMKTADAVALELSKPIGATMADSLRRCADFLEAAGMQSLNSDDRLRQLFVLLFGLGIMESTGRHCCGWDRGKLNGWGDPDREPIQPTAENSEAGLFQTSFDIFGSVKSGTAVILREIFSRYRANPDGLIEYFSKGAKCKTGDKENIPPGEGQEFQRLSKECPGFTVEFTGLVLRHVSSHWNPVVNIGHKEKGLQIKTECDRLLKQVQAYVDAHGFDNTPANTTHPVMPAPVDNQKAVALNLAAQIGQREQLERMFQFAPESRANYWAVVDFNQPSSKERLFIFDLKSGTVKSYLVAHGKNSGELNATEFSNEVGSNQSSLGIYKVAETYNGIHGKSVRIDGEEASNSKARARYIVIHEADYVVPNYKGTGRAGRSDGCFALNPKDIDEVIDNLRDGSYLVAWHG